MWGPFRNLSLSWWVLGKWNWSMPLKNVTWANFLWWAWLMTGCDAEIFVDELWLTCFIMIWLWGGEGMWRGFKGNWKKFQWRTTVLKYLNGAFRVLRLPFLTPGAGNKRSQLYVLGRIASWGVLLVENWWRGRHTIKWWSQHCNILQLDISFAFLKEVVNFCF